MKFSVSEQVCWRAGEEESLSLGVLCLFSVRACYSQWQSTGSFQGFVPANSDSPNADHGLDAGVLGDGNLGQCVCKRTVIFVQLHLCELWLTLVFTERCQCRAGSALMELEMRYSSTKSPL